MKNLKLFVTIFVLSGFLFFMSSRTYSALVASADIPTNVGLAKWNILINDVNISSNYDKTVSINNIDWINDYADKYSAVPGSTGIVNIVMNPVNTQVAFKFELTFVDNVQDSNKILTFENITVDGIDLVRTGKHTYSGIFTLADINANKSHKISIQASWINDESNNERDTLILNEELDPDFIDLHFVAKQYHGEVLEEYDG